MRSIKSKLLAGYGLVLMFFAVSVVLSLRTMGAMNAEAEELGHVSVPAAQALGEIRNSLNTMRSTELDALNAPDAKIYRIASTVHAQAKAEADAAFATYQRLAAPGEDRKL